MVVGGTADGSASWTQGNKRISTQTVVYEEIFYHHRRSGTRVFYIHGNQVITVLVVQTSSCWSLGLLDDNVADVTESHSLLGDSVCEYF